VKITNSGWSTSRACATTRRSPITARVIQTATVNLLRVFASGPAGQGHPSRSNLARLGLDPSDG
jgi:hypothetical protein